jgi:RNA polymerase sigma factor (TIGR02999 family)
MTDRSVEITSLLREWQAGSPEAFQRVIPLVYDELKLIASRHLSREWRRGQLETNVVVNEAYLKLFGQREVDWQNRGHFFAVAAQLMRRILVDHARRELRLKRGGRGVSVTLADDIPAATSTVDIVETLDLDNALTKLDALDPDAARLIEMRFFGGLTLEETAAALGVSLATVKRDWAVVKGWLYRELASQAAPGGAQSAP